MSICAASSPAGSIPACAGEPPAGCQDGRAPEVYPRVCGGTRPGHQRDCAADGLSPRVRGNPAPTQAESIRARSIPACAGEPRPASRCRPCGTVYPRVCGGTVVMASGDSRDWGLSPRVRGNLPLRRLRPDGPGSIPACAGEPVRPDLFQTRETVYPRVCGGTSAPWSSWPSARGLSPRVRGNRAASRACMPAARSIPACAGEPRRWRSCGSAGRVYPRVCGGTRWPPFWNSATTGLSPRVRGNP